MSNSFVVHITGNPNITSLVLVNVRADAGTGTDVAVLFQKRVGTRNLPVLNVKSDLDNRAINGKVYQWFQVKFPEANGWVRDDLVSIEGDGTAYGYPVLTQPTYAFSLLRQLSPAGSSAPASPKEVSPASNQPTPTPAPAPTPATPATPTPAPAPAPVSTDVTATVIGRNGLNLRDSANGPNPKNRRLSYQEVLKVLGATPQAGTAYIWAQVQRSSGDVGWARTDYLSLSGDGSRFGLSKGDEYPAPMQNYWWVRGQNDVQPDGSVDKHLGWDFSANEGTPIVCGPRGGWVMKVLTCTKCTAAQPSSIQQGHPINDPAVFKDEAWGFGYGNAPIIRYTNDLLPASTQKRLADAGMAGAHLFVIYAHMNSVNVKPNQQLGAFTQLGVIGNAGNSTATHLHLEVHASANANDTNFGGMREFDPQILYLR